MYSTIQGSTSQETTTKTPNQHHLRFKLAPILSYGTGFSVRSHSPLNALIIQLLNPEEESQSVRIY